MSEAKSTNLWRKILTDFGPLILFFVAFKFGGIMVATGVFMASMVVAIIASKLLDGKIPPMLWVTFAIVIVMGSLTLYLNDETFVKMKPTIVNGIFAVILFFGLVTGRPLLKTVLASGFPPLAERGWTLMTRNWAFFFVAMAAINEAVWRTQSTDTWVDFKTFGFLPLTFLFAISQAPILNKYQIKEDGEEA
ncbi:septation protein A [Gimibacter soli]|uniref:Inner membrane-spanning protein YciB n=1 Tax=Gimibacter soli TaxID=3024400 RepID=A0AAE9XQK3_9PROT|nr:septation protein A [Gimibacter soli]WCL54454.1 septation protein A [Gimibacter soli]